MDEQQRNLSNEFDYEYFKEKYSQEVIPELNHHLLNLMIHKLIQRVQNVHHHFKKPILRYTDIHICKHDKCGIPCLEKQFLRMNTYAYDSIPMNKHHYIISHGTVSGNSRSDMNRMISYMIFILNLIVKNKNIFKYSKLIQDQNNYLLADIYYSTFI